MTALLRFAILGFVLGAALAQQNVELYSDKYDNVDVDTILQNDEWRTRYYNCFMDLGPCQTADAIFFKGNFPEAIATKCARCTEKQKENFNKMADWYTKNDPESWNAFIQKYLNEARARNYANY